MAPTPLSQFFKNQIDRITALLRVPSGHTKGSKKPSMSEQEGE